MHITYFFPALLALLAAFAGSSWIDYLYSKPKSPISYPDKLQGRHLFRMIFLTGIYFATEIYCIKMPPFYMFYHVTAAFFLALIVVTDFEQYIIFDTILLPFALSGICFTLISEPSLSERLVAAFVGGALFFTLMILTKNGIGGGDVKLVATLGLWLGSDLLPTLLNASILGGISAAFLLLSGLKRRTDYFAYGPYLCIATAWQIFKP